MNQSIGGDRKKASYEEPFSYLVTLRVNLIRQQTAPVPFPTHKRCSRVVLDNDINNDDAEKIRCNERPQLGL